MPIRRNDEAHFSSVPKVAIERSRMDRSKSHKFSGNVGDLIPIYWEQVLPGDTITMDTSKIVRFQTMQTPVMDDLFCDIHWWFIPERLCWIHFKEFMGENSSSAWIPQVTYTKPKLRVYDPRYSTGIAENFNKTGTLLDYMGFPVGVQLDSASSYVDIDATPFRAYALVADQWWRNQNVSDPLVISTGDSTVNATGLSSETYIQTVAKGGHPFVACKTFDLFTACLPTPQKGSAVQLPLGDKAPVYATTTDHFSAGAVKPNGIAPMSFIGAAGTNFDSESGWHNLTLYNGEAAMSDATPPGTVASYPTPNNLWADLSAATAATISDLRMAFQLQRYYERLARGGSRYTEIISNFFHVQSPDARLQRPEYLGGNRFPISVDQVANAAQTSTDALGDVGAFSRTTDVHSDFTFSSSEHGILLGTMVVRYNHSYTQGLEKKFTRFEKLDYYLPTFAHISEQPIDKSELYVGASGTFGYNEAWSQYRYAPNTCAGEMRPYVSNSLGSWHLADDYNAAPTLSDAWMREDKTNVDRVLTVTSQAANQFWCDFYFKTFWTRPMPLYSVPGLMDHF